MIKKIKKKLYCIKNRFYPEEVSIISGYKKKYFNYSFDTNRSDNLTQYEANITRWYHTIEKGLAYENYRPGFGKDNILILLKQLEQYSKEYDIEKFFYRTALSTLHEYVRKNREYGYVDEEVEKRIEALPGHPNEFGGVIKVSMSDMRTINYEDFVKSRHSVRHFSDKPLDIEVVKEAVALAQHTPSACNRQGWKSYIVQDKEKIKQLLENQNGNRGFGHEFDKLILVTGDLRAFNRSREVFQVYIDGGMYAVRVLDSLYYKGIAACPLSASLTPSQEKNARRILNLDDAEIFIMYIGIGNYPEEGCQTTRSERHEPYTVVV